MLALRTNVYIWKCPLNKYIDDQLYKVGIKLIDISWKHCTLIRNDMNHFTWKGYKNFCRYLNHELKKILQKDTKIHIITDSTVDYHNYTKNYRYNGKANKFLKLYLKNYKVTIDSQCGSGFHAETSFVSRMLNIPYGSKVLFIGGWNDYSYSKIKHSINHLLLRFNH